MRDRDPDLVGAKKLAADVQQANFHRGQFYLLSRIRISDAGFTEGGYVPTGDQSGGLSLTVEAPNRLYYVPHKKTIFSAEFVPGYSFFNESERGRQFNYLVRGDAHLLLNHAYLDFYALRADRIVAHVADINRLATARENEVGVASEFKYSSRTSALITARLAETAYPTNRFQPDLAPLTEIPVQVLDRKEKNLRVSLLHKTFPRTSLFVAGEGSQYDFTNKAAYTSRRTYLGGGFNYDGGRTVLTMEAGPMKLAFDDPSQRDYSGVIARLRWSRGNGRWAYNAAADRDLGFSVFRDNAYFVSTSGTVGVDYVATRKLTLHARTSLERDEYDTPVLGLDRRDDIQFTSVGFDYGLRTLRLGVDVGWYERTSTAFGDEASGIRYALRLSFTP
ncbi:MAG: hypothetical protein ABI779_23425 [Acidobacteriota bacterium]